jgi:hypothetical protein
MMAPEDVVDGRDGHIHLVVPLQEADLDRPILPFVSDLEDQDLECVAESRTGAGGDPHCWALTRR